MVFSDLQQRSQYDGNGTSAHHLAVIYERPYASLISAWRAIRWRQRALPESPRQLERSHRKCHLVTTFLSDVSDIYWQILLLGLEELDSRTTAKPSDCRGIDNDGTAGGLWFGPSSAWWCFFFGHVGLHRRCLWRFAGSSGKSRTLADFGHRSRNVEWPPKGTWIT